MTASVVPGIPAPAKIRGIGLVPGETNCYKSYMIKRVCRRLGGLSSVIMSRCTVEDVNHAHLDG